MTIPSFSRFRLGDPLELEAGGYLRYDDLASAGLQDYYIRIIYKAVSKNKADKAKLDEWLNRARSTDKVVGRALRAELENLQPKTALPPKQAKTPAKRRKAREKMFVLHSKSNHKQALKLAEEYGLTPVPLPKASLRPGQSEEAHSVQAPSAVASKLITSGNWSTAD